MNEKEKTIKKRISQDKNLIIEQLKKTPIVSIAAEKTGIGRSTYYRWRKSDLRFSSQADSAIAEGTMLVNDMAESQVLALIRDGNLTAAIFWLKYHHPSYETRIELRQAANAVDKDLSKMQRSAVEKVLELLGENKHAIEGAQSSE
jgi:ACT domain-containing protein